MRHKGRAPVWVWLLGAGFAIAAMVIAMPRQQAGAKPVAFADVKQVIDTRCVVCHAEKPSFQGLGEAPKGVRLDTPERIRAQALQIHQQTVLSKAMPLGNLTNMTEDERALLDRWYRSGGATP
jgi:uncharacterized membrane protein